MPIITFLSFAQHVILTVASWLFSHGENHLDPELWENSGATRVSEHRVTRKEKVRIARTPKVLKSCWGKRLEGLSRPRGSRQLPRLHLKIMMFANPDESSSSKTRTLDTTNRSVLAFSGRPERTRSKKPRSRRLRKMKTRSGTLVDASRHPGHGLLHLLLPGENGAQTRRVSVPIGNRQPVGVAQIKRVSVPIGS